MHDAAGQTMRYLVGAPGHQVVGFGLLVFERPAAWVDSTAPAYVPIIIDLFTAERYRGQGIGTALIAAMEQLVRERGGVQLYLSVEPLANPRAAALYTRLGYHPLQEAPYRNTWEFTDSDGMHHTGDEELIDMVKLLT